MKQEASSAIPSATTFPTFSVDLHSNSHRPFGPYIHHTYTRFCYTVHIRRWVEVERTKPGQVLGEKEEEERRRRPEACSVWEEGQDTPPRFTNSLYTHPQSVGASDRTLLRRPRGDVGANITFAARIDYHLPSGYRCRRPSTDSGGILRFCAPERWCNPTLHAPRLPQRAAALPPILHHSVHNSCIL